MFAVTNSERKAKRDGKNENTVSELGKMRGSRMTRRMTVWIVAIALCCIAQSSYGIVTPDDATTATTVASTFASPSSSSSGVTKSRPTTPSTAARASSSTTAAAAKTTTTAASSAASAAGFVSSSAFLHKHANQAVVSGGNSGHAVEINAVGHGAGSASSSRGSGSGGANGEKDKPAGNALKSGAESVQKEDAASVTQTASDRAEDTHVGNVVDAAGTRTGTTAATAPLQVTEYHVDEVTNAWIPREMSVCLFLPCGY